MDDSKCLTIARDVHVHHVHVIWLYICTCTDVRWSCIDVTS